MGNKLLDVGPLELEVIGALHAAGERSVSQIQAALKEAVEARLKKRGRS
jgi:hypothetical protein